jgi:hypothetical protein
MPCYIPLAVLKGSIKASCWMEAALASGAHSAWVAAGWQEQSCPSQQEGGGENEATKNRCAKSSEALGEGKLDSLPLQNVYQ